MLNETARPQLSFQMAPQPLIMKVNDVSESIKTPSSVHLAQRFSTWVTHTPGGMPEVFEGVRRGLAEAKVMCSGANMLSLYVVYEGENAFLSNSHKTYSCQANIQRY